MSNPKVEVALKNSCGSIGEGPHWDDASQSLLYVDIKNLDVHRYNPTTGEDQIRHLSECVGLSVCLPYRFVGRSVCLPTCPLRCDIVLLKPVLNWANVCSPNILRTVR